MKLSERIIEWSFRLYDFYTAIGRSLSVDGGALYIVMVYFIIAFLTGSVLLLLLAIFGISALGYLVGRDVRAYYKSKNG